MPSFIARRICSAIAMVGVLTASRSPGQSPAPRPEFDVASIRLNTDGGPVVFNGMKSLGTFSSENQTLKNLIEEAYGSPRENATGFRFSRPWE
jgi:hypothetical protein